MYVTYKGVLINNYLVYINNKGSGVKITFIVFVLFYTSHRYSMSKSTAFAYLSFIVYTYIPFS